MKPCRIALSGKGGTGKTTLAALLVTELVASGETPVLAVDADPNANLHEALGVDVRETLGRMREDAFTRTIPAGTSRKQYIALRFRQVLVESKGFDLVAMGRPEGLGCYCFANTLLSEAMEGLEKGYRWVVVDSEAGMEHISRGSVGRPDILLVMSDPSARGMRTAVRIRDLAVSLGLESRRIFLVLNRAGTSREPWKDKGFPLLGIIPEDPAVEKADVSGTPLAVLGKTAPSRIAAGNILESLMKTGLCPSR